MPHRTDLPLTSASHHPTRCHHTPHIWTAVAQGTLSRAQLHTTQTHAHAHIHIYVHIHARARAHTHTHTCTRARAPQLWRGDKLKGSTGSTLVSLLRKHVLTFGCTGLLMEDSDPCLLLGLRFPTSTTYRNNPKSPFPRPFLACFRARADQWGRSRPSALGFPSRVLLCGAHDSYTAVLLALWCIVLCSSPADWGH